MLSEAEGEHKREKRERKILYCGGRKRKRECLNEGEGENCQRKGLAKSPRGTQLSRNLSIYNLVKLVMAQGRQLLHMDSELEETCR